MTNKLIEICDFKRKDVARRKAATSLSSLHAAFARRWTTQPVPASA